MPRRSSAELELTLTLTERDGRKVEVNPPGSLRNPRMRDAFREVVFRFPHVAQRPNWEGAVANYVLLQARARLLVAREEDACEFFQVMTYISRLAKFLDLPATAYPVRRKAVTRRR
jgi:hypothetical protein